MTRETIEVLEPQEQEITICDDCQREVDDGGITDVSCDFCSTCRDDYTDGPPSHVIRADEWTDSDIPGSPTAGSMSADFRYMIVSGWLLSFLSVGAFGYTARATGWGTYTVAAILAAVLSMTMLMAAYAVKSHYVAIRDARGDD